MLESLKILIETEEEVNISEPTTYTEDVNVGGSGSLDFGEDIDISETAKARLKRYYNEIALQYGYKDIEEFYVKKKFELAMKGEKYSKSDDYMSNLLKTIAMDMGYTSHSKEFVMQNTLPSISGKDLIGR